MLYGRNRPLCAVHGAGRAFVGIRADEFLETFRTLRCSKILYSHKSEYNLCNLSMPVLKSSFCSQYLCELRAV